MKENKDKINLPQTSVTFTKKTELKLVSTCAKINICVN
jgi:hypothetical protein